MIWQCANRSLDLSVPRVMGIVNATPDSFSDGGSYCPKDHALRLIEAGADIVDIGGESTKPGSEPVSLTEELERVLPVVEALQGSPALISIDTSKPEVMKQALLLGAHAINDVKALGEPGAMEVVAQAQAGVCLMHMRGTPSTMQRHTTYDDVVTEVESFLLERARACEQIGILKERIVLDYGFGFGKTVADNFKLLAHTHRFVQSEYPLLVGLSRKSSLGAVTGRETQDRVVASVAGALIAVERGASIVRVHDVHETVDALKVWMATQENK